MANIYRLVIFFAFLFFSSAFAAISPVQEFAVAKYDGGFTGWYSSLSSACSAVGSGGPVGGDGIPSYIGGDVQDGVCYYKYKSGSLSTINAPHKVRDVCPPNSETSQAGGCVCQAGFSEKNGQCVPNSDEQCVFPLKKDSAGKCSCPAGQHEEKKDGVTACVPNNSTDLCKELAGKGIGVTIQADYGSKSPGQLGRMVGKPSTTCFAGGCTVSGTIGGCWSAGGVAACDLGNPVFTGESCDDKAPPGDCPAGSSPSQYAAGVCIPDENKCPSGSTPSKYASGVCIPDENKCPSGQVPSKYAAGVCLPADDKGGDGNGEAGDKSKCPTGYVASRYAAGVCIPADTTVTGANGGGGNTTCKDGKCTTTKPDGSKDEKPQNEFCKENPDASICKKGSFGGSCGNFTCEGDAVQCAIAKKTHENSCKMFNDKSPESDLYDKEKGKEGSQSKDLPGNETIDIKGKIDTSDALNAPQTGMQDINITVMNKQIALPFSQINPYLEIMGKILLAISFLIAARIVTRG